MALPDTGGSTPSARETADLAGREAPGARGSNGPVAGGPGPKGLLVLPSASAVVILLAIASNLAKGEVERIYLPFTIWFLPLAALLPVRSGPRWLAGQCTLTLLIALTTTLSW